MAIFPSPWAARAAGGAAAGFQTLDPAAAVAVHPGVYAVTSVTAAAGVWTVTGLSDSGLPGTPSGCRIYWFQGTGTTWANVITSAAQLSQVAVAAAGQMGVGLAWGSNTDPAAPGYYGRMVMFNMGNGAVFDTTWGCYGAMNNAAMAVTGGANLFNSVTGHAWIAVDATNIRHFIGGVSPNGVVSRNIAVDTALAGADPIFFGVALCRTVAAVGGVAGGTFKPQVT